MDLETLYKLWLILKELPSEQLLVLGAGALFLVVTGFGFGRWSARHTYSTIQTENTILTSKLDVLGGEKSSNDELRKENAILKEVTKIPNVETLRYENGLYYNKNILGSPLPSFPGSEINNGPFCPRCWQADRLKIGLQKTNDGWACISNSCYFHYHHSSKKNPA